MYKRLFMVLIIVVLALTTGCGQSTSSTASGEKTVSKTLKPGEFSSYDIKNDQCGIGLIDGKSIWDSRKAFEQSERKAAVYLWFSNGWMTWDFPVDLPSSAKIKSISYSAEIASEAPASNANYPSQINLKINDVFIGNWIVPGDPGGQPAKQKNHLATWASQYGWLTTWTVDKSGTYVEYKFRDGDKSKFKISDVTVDKINVNNKIKITIEPNSTDKGSGLNMYGETWGDYGVNPKVTVTYSDK